MFFPAAEFLNTTRITTVSGHLFKTEGKVLVKPGWLTVYGKTNQDDQELVAVAPNESIQTEKMTSSLDHFFCFKGLSKRSFDGWA